MPWNKCARSAGKVVTSTVSPDEASVACIADSSNEFVKWANRF